MSPAGRVAKRVGWGLGDQLLSSLTNFAVSLAVARVVDTAEFGAFSLIFAIYAIALGLSRAITTEPLVVRFSSSDGAKLAQAERCTAGSALCLGVGSGAICVILGVVVGGSYAPLFIVLGAAMPALLLQDAWRFIFIVRGEGRKAFYNDLVWLIALIAGFGAVALVGESVAALTIAWGAGATVAAIVGIAQARVLPDVRAASHWLRSNWHLSSRYLPEAIAITGAMQAYLLLIALIAGLDAVGEIKLVLVVLSPVNVLTQAVGLAVLPEVVRTSRESARSMSRMLLTVSAALTLGAAAWGLLIAILPESTITAIAGPSWPAAMSLLLPLVLLQMLNGANTGAYMGLRALQATNSGLAVRLIVSADFIVLATVGAALGAATGAAWALAIAAAVNCCLWWTTFVIVWKRRQGAPAPQR